MREKRNSVIIGVTVAMVAVSLMFIMLFGEALGISRVQRDIGYEDRLFNTSEIHTLDIIMDSWEEFLKECENEQYRSCSVIIDGERFNYVGIRAKGNTSLSTVRVMGGRRYSLKLEFDYYQNGITYYGLDKLNLNNLIQDNTYMKDYLTFRLMDEFEAPSPLCSYVKVMVNGEPWGLFLAVEGIEESFLRRNYGNATGSLYKPEPGGPGDGNLPAPPAGMDGAMPLPLEIENEGFTPPEMATKDTKLQYIDDNPNSYSGIFGTAKTHVTQADKMRLIHSLEKLNNGLQDPDILKEVLYYDDVLRYFVVHNYAVNGDSYTGRMTHNYYLYEKDGKLALFPWDYNLGFGCFQNMDASAAVNDPIDMPLSVTGDGERPMADWLVQKANLEEYHRSFREFLGIDIDAIIDEAYQLIAPYAGSDTEDPTHFCTQSEFESAVATLREFCHLRSQSVQTQLNNPRLATDEGQAIAGRPVDASSLNLSLMGSMETTGGNGPQGEGKGDSSAFEDGKDSDNLQEAEVMPQQEPDPETESTPEPEPDPGQKTESSLQSEVSESVSEPMQDINTTQQSESVPEPNAAEPSESTRTETDNNQSSNNSRSGQEERAQNSTSQGGNTKNSQSGSTQNGGTRNSENRSGNTENSGSQSSRNQNSESRDNQSNKDNKDNKDNNDNTDSKVKKENGNSQTLKPSGTASSPKEESKGNLSNDSSPTHEPTQITQPTQESSTETQTTQESSTEAQTTQESSTETQTTHESTTETQATQESTTETQATQESTTETQTTQESTTETQTTQESTTETQTTQEPTTETQSSPEPTPDTQSSPEPTPDTQSSPEPTPDTQSSPEPTPEIQSSPEPTPDTQSTPEPTPDTHSTPAPTTDEQSTPGPAPDEQSTPDPAPDTNTVPKEDSMTKENDPWADPWAYDPESA